MKEAFFHFYMDLVLSQNYRRNWQRTNLIAIRGLFLNFNFCCYVGNGFLIILRLICNPIPCIQLKKAMIETKKKPSQVVYFIFANKSITFTANSLQRAPYFSCIRLTFISHRNYCSLLESHYKYKK